MECEFPTVNSNPEEEKAIFGETKTIAVIGLSPDPAKDSHRVARYLQEAGYRILPVYPKGESILGEKVYHSLLEIQEKVDLVDVFRKPEAVPDIVDQALARKDVRALWLQIGIVNNAAAERAKGAGLRVVQNKCAMVEHRRICGETKK